MQDKCYVELNKTHLLSVDQIGILELPIDESYTFLETYDQISINRNIHKYIMSVMNFVMTVYQEIDFNAVTLNFVDDDGNMITTCIVQGIKPKKKTYNTNVKFYNWAKSKISLNINDYLNGEAYYLPNDDLENE